MKPKPRRFLAALLCVTALTAIAIPASAATAAKDSTGYSFQKVNEHLILHGRFYFHDGLIPVTTQVALPDGKTYATDGFAYLTTDGKILKMGGKACGYDYSDGLAPFWDDELGLGYMDTNGNVVIPPQFEVRDTLGILHMGRFIDGNALVYHKASDTWTQIDRTGKEVPKTLDENTEYAVSGGVGIGAPLYGSYAGNRSGVTSETVTFHGHTYTLDFSEGYALAILHEDETDWGPRGIYIVKRNSPIAPTLPDTEPPKTESPEPAEQGKVSDWAKDEIDLARQAGLITEHTSSDMTRDITRFQFAELAVNLAEKATGKEITAAPDTTFTDCKEVAVLKAYAAGIVSGVGNNTFAPDQTTNREQIATMVYRAITYIEKETGKEFTAKNTDLAQFTDMTSVSTWAAEGVGVLANNGIMKGTSDMTLSPSHTCSVEQSILLVYRVFNLAK